MTALVVIAIETESELSTNATQSASRLNESKRIALVPFFFLLCGDEVAELLVKDHFSPSLGPGPPPMQKLPAPPSAPGVGPGLPPPPPQGPPVHVGYASTVSNPVGSPAEPSSSTAGPLVPLGPGPTGGFPDDLDPHNVPPELKKEGSDWFAVFNPKVKRVLDVSLVHTLMHERCV